MGRHVVQIKKNHYFYYKNVDLNYDLLLYICEICIKVICIKGSY